MPSPITTTATLAPMASPVTSLRVAQVPVVFGEFGETYHASSCATTNTQAMVNWADAHVVNDEAWTWDTWGLPVADLGLEPHSQRRLRHLDPQPLPHVPSDVTGRLPRTP